MKILKIVFVLLLILSICHIIHAQNNIERLNETQFPFNNTELSMDERISDLVKRLSVEEKCAFLLYDFKGIENLNIPAYNWWNEALHGVARAGKATVFPQAIGLAATFNDDLIEEVATVISDEARAKYVAAIRKNSRQRYTGLTFWSPNINIFRDPRWGRGQETYGEDPYLTAKMGVAFVKGLQGDHPEYLKTSACAKHFVVHSGPESLRHEFDAITSEFDLRNTYLPAFKSLAEAGVSSVMCAYNRTNGEPCCGSEFLLLDMLRDEFKFDGYIVSDCGAIRDIWMHHKVAEDAKAAAAIALKSGVDVNCGRTYDHLMEAYNAGLISEEIIDISLKKNLKILFRLGWFDPQESFIYNQVDPSIVASEAHTEIARKAARESIVMLKNDNVLPLDKYSENLKRIFVTGPNASGMKALWGNYNGYSGNFVTLLEGIVGAVDAGTIVEYEKGCELVNDFNFRGTYFANSADITIAALGYDLTLEGEEGAAYLSEHGGDRIDLKLPENQIELVKDLRKRTKGKLIAVIMAGSAISLSDIEPFADAIIYAWYPGEQGGNAIADVIFGDYNPTGRLPVTIYHSVNDLPAYEDYSIKGKTYRYFKGEAAYPFGYGLSYSKFVYERIQLNKKKFTSINDTLTVTLELENKGLYDGNEIVQIYARLEGSDERFPEKSLVFFKSIPVAAGNKITVNCSIPMSDFKYYLPELKKYVVPKGKWRIMVGSSSDNIHLYENISTNI